MILLIARQLISSLSFFFFILQDLYNICSLDICLSLFWNYIFSI